MPLAAPADAVLTELAALDSRHLEQAPGRHSRQAARPDDPPLTESALPPSWDSWPGEVMTEIGVAVREEAVLNDVCRRWATGEQSQCSANVGYMPTLEVFVVELSARDFNQDVSAAKRAAAEGPVVITDRGQPSHVLLSIADYRRLVGDERSIVDWLSADDDIDVEPDRVKLKFQVPGL